MGQTKILVIDDDSELNDLLSDFFESQGAKVITVERPSMGLKKVRDLHPDVVVLDVMLPEMDGFEVAKKIRENSAVPIVMLTARGDVNDRITGLEIGADDYMPKPFDVRELWTRIQAVLRRTYKNFGVTGQYDFDGLEIDVNTQSVKLDGKALDLTTAEFEMLRLFAENPQKPLDRDFMMEQTRGIPWESFNRSVDVVVSRLRQKLGDDPRHPRFLKTIWGTGYMFIGQTGEESAGEAAEEAAPVVEEAPVEVKEEKSSRSKKR
ncbi:MAG: response regulator transcription factor [Chlorobi bacterium]|nr:MAG: OmpR family response regulator [Chlorobi bacterium OLB7]MBK8911900.1 response regulator transcription factor [Chlorobiota bacterium]MBX7215459.1 response regulator transcription factor [Candidatus Kapabacteria bacterium]